MNEFMPFLCFVHVMFETSQIINVRERCRALRVAESHLIRCEIVAQQRMRQQRFRPFNSCLLDSCKLCAREAKLRNVVRDLSVVTRDVVRAGLQGSRRAASNFNALQRIFIRHGVHIAVLSLDGEKLCCHRVGWEKGHCFGVLFWDKPSRHAIRVPVLLSENLLASESQPPWAYSCVGGKRPKSKPKPKAKATKRDRPPFHREY